MANDAFPRPSSLPLRIVRPLQEFLRTEAGGGVLLLLAAAAALVWANAPFGGSYGDFWGTHVRLDLRVINIDLSLRAWVNDGLMASFYVVGMEVKREVLQGELADRRKAALPVAAAAGGMLVPALIYLALNAGRSGEHGWAYRWRPTSRSPLACRPSPANSRADMRSRCSCWRSPSSMTRRHHRHRRSSTAEAFLGWTRGGGGRRSSWIFAWAAGDPARPSSIWRRRRRVGPTYSVRGTRDDRRRASRPDHTDAASPATRRLEQGVGEEVRRTLTPTPPAKQWRARQKRRDALEREARRC